MCFAPGFEVDPITPIRLNCGRTLCGLNECSGSSDEILEISIRWSRYQMMHEGRPRGGRDNATDLGRVIFERREELRPLNFRNAYLRRSFTLQDVGDRKNGEDWTWPGHGGCLPVPGYGYYLRRGGATAEGTINQGRVRRVDRVLLN